MANVQPLRGIRERDETGPYLGIRGPGIVYVKDKPRFVREALAKQAGVKATAKDRDGAAKNLQIIRDELSDVWHVWRTTHADQPGLSHEVMQKARDLARHAPVTTATLLVAITVALVVALVN